MYLKPNGGVIMNQKQFKINLGMEKTTPVTTNKTMVSKKLADGVFPCYLD